MKNKSLFYTLLVLLIFANFMVMANISMAATVKFTPNVPIPGTPFAGEVNITPDSIGQYMSALYTYGAGFAGAAAMFMLVFAGWQWLLAGGNASKIERAKDTINGVLIGLFLLFGGYLLLSQISSGLVSFDGLTLARIDPQLADVGYCRAQNAAAPENNGTGCGSQFFVGDSNIGDYGIVCIDTICPSGESCIENETGVPCPPAITEHQPVPSCNCVKVSCSDIDFNGNGNDYIGECGVYNNQADCRNNTCFGQTGSNGEEMRAGCYWDDASGNCFNIENRECYADETCEPENVDLEYHCNYSTDRCRTGPRPTN